MARLIFTYLGLFLLGAIVSYLGNQLGRYIGRKKMSVFNLRPRHTSVLITSLTGSLIATTTLTFALLSSWEIRTFFTTGLTQYGNKVSEITAKTIEQTQMGGVIYRPGEPILTAIIDGTKTPEQIRDQIEQTMTYVNREALQKNESVAEIMQTQFTHPDDGKIAGYYNRDMDNLVSALDKIKGKVILEPTADNYVLLGEKFTVRFIVKEYIPKVLNQGDEIISGKINGSETAENIASDLSKLILKAKIKAINQGMIENPITLQLIEIKRSEFTDTIQEIANSKQICDVTVRALKETDNRGPLEIYMDIKKAI